jgi:hypothetical protein
MSSQHGLHFSDVTPVSCTRWPNAIEAYQTCGTLADAAIRKYYVREVQHLSAAVSTGTEPQPSLTHGYCTPFISLNSFRSLYCVCAGKEMVAWNCGRSTALDLPTLVGRQSTTRYRQATSGVRFTLVWFSIGAHWLRRLSDGELEGLRSRGFPVPE